MVDIIPNWHPIFVHFTVALLSIAVLLKLAPIFVGNASLHAQWLIVARWNLWLGAGFTVLTVATGWLAYNSVTHDTPSHAAMTDHRNWALVTAPLFVAVAIWSVLQARAGKGSSVLLLVVLLVASGLLGATAWRGGEVVYRYGLGVMSLPKSDSHGHAPGVADDHDDAANMMKGTDGHDDANSSDSHGHDSDVADDHHDNVDAMMKENDGHGETPMDEGKIHTHTDGTVEAH